MSIKSEKLEIAGDIIQLAIQQGTYKRMLNGQYPTKELIAASHSLPELRKLYSKMRGR